MHRDTEHPAVRLVALATLAVLILSAGCSDDDDDPTAPAITDTEARFWVGTLTGDATRDTWEVALALDREGPDLDGQLLLLDRIGGVWQLFQVLGTVADHTVDLEIDPAHGADPDDFACRLSGWEGGLAGTLTVGWTSTGGAVSVRDVPRRTLIEVGARMHEEGFSGLVHDGDQLWLPTFGEGWHRYDDEGSYLGLTEVLLHDPDIYWTSPHVAWDGAFLHGSHPVNVSGDDGTTHVADIVTFTSGGVVETRTRISHRTRGLAWDGEAFYSLDPDAGHLHRVAPDGQDLAVRNLEVSDLYHLEVADGRLFAQGWFLQHLFELDAEGTLVAVHDYPAGRDVVGPRGGALAPDGDLLCGVQIRGGASMVLAVALPAAD
ncbi:hypothetical protein GF314_06565 [bacterium]|nr:hypothetical protein [bacterium]